ncbi:MAG: proliferating cell nuclear antigen (pcna) [Thermoproteota archaeon]
MRLEFFDARVWRYLVTSISRVIEEGIFIVDPEEGLTFRAMDPSHVVLVQMRFPPTAFDVFEVEDKTTIGVNFEDLGKVLRRATKDDRLMLSLEDNSFVVTFRGKGERSFWLPLLDVAAEEVPEPRLEYKAVASIISDAYRDMLKDLELVGDVITFVASEDRLLAISSSETAEVEIAYTMESGSLIELQVEDEQRASYSLEYFIDLSPAARVADKITIKFSSAMPVQVDHELPESAYFGFLVAPRVE